MSARELAPVLEYAKWENFSKVIGRAMIACENSGHDISNDFPEIRKIVEAGATSKPKKDYELSRYACYLREDKMNEFELFTMIFFVLDAYYDKDIDDICINTVLSDMNPFIWADIGSADPAMYDEYKKFLKERTITLENSFDIAKDYVKTIEYADVTPAFDEMDQKRWIAYCKEYLSEPHKGGDVQNL